MLFKQIKQLVKLTEDFFSLLGRLIILTIIFDIDNRRKHIVDGRDSRYKIFSLCFAGTVIAEKVVCADI